MGDKSIERGAGCFLHWNDGWAFPAAILRLLGRKDGLEAVAAAGSPPGVRPPGMFWIAKRRISR
jgi:hypothetical protein